ncbi:MAG: coenzyme F420-0:L-glutamate ligase [Alphaproteobacteria bacterium]
MVHLIPVTTRTLIPPQDDIIPVLLKKLPPLHEGDVIVITSKVIAISQGRCIPTNTANLDNLIHAECDAFIPKEQSQYGVTLTLTGGTLIANAGIDASNANNHYILWPTEPSLWAQTTCQLLQSHFGLNHLAIIVTDSTCIPLRWGVNGLSIGFYGLKPLYDYRHTPDLFGNPLQVTQGSIVDPIAAAAVGIMGEGNESTPIVIVRGWPRITFVNHPTHEGFFIPPEKDLYAPLWTTFTRNPI